MSAPIRFWWKTGFVFLLACTVAAIVAGPALAAPGALDPSFSGNGKVTTGFNVGPAGAEAIAVQADGRIVAAGTAGSRFALVRYRPNGNLDTSFGGDGKVTTAFLGGAGATAVAIQADRKIVAAGSAGSRFGLVRYNPNGSPDTSFGGDGRVTTRFDGAIAYAVVIQANGRIVAAGGGGERDGFALARYRPNGNLDTSFGGDGKVRNGSRLGFSVANGLAIQGDGKIVAAGVVDYFGFALARYNHNGTLDRSFGGDGQVSTIVGQGEGGATSVAIQANGKIVAAGSTDAPHQAGDAFGPGRFALARYRPDGTPDASFGRHGVVTTRFGDRAAVANAVAIHEGNLVAAGSSHDGTRFALARYELDGTRNPSFGNDGRVVTRFQGGGAASGVAIQDDGKILAAGWAADRFGLARYLVA